MVSSASLPLPSSSLLRHSWSSIGDRMISSDAGTISGDGEPIINDDLEKEVDEFVSQYIGKIKNCLDYLTGEINPSENELLEENKLNKFEYVYNELENIRLKKNKNDLKEFLITELENYNKNSCNVKRIQINKIKLNIEIIDLNLNVAKNVNEKINGIEDKYKKLPSFYNVFLRILEIITSFLGGVMAYSAKAAIVVAPCLVNIFLAMLLLVFFLKIYKSLKEYMSDRTDQQSLPKGWLSNIRTYMPNAEDESSAVDLKSRLNIAKKEAKNRQREWTQNALSEVLSTPSSRSPSLLRGRKRSFREPRRRQCSAPVAFPNQESNYPNYKAPSVGSSSCIDSQQAGVDEKGLDKAFKEKRTFFSRSKLKNLEESSVNSIDKNICSLA